MMFEIGKQVKEAAEAGMKVYPCHSNRSSSIGHPCIKYLVLMRTQWRDQTIPKDKALLFSLGNVFEDYALEKLRASGFKISEIQRPFEWKAYQLTGTVDCKIAQNGSVPVPCEIKGLSPANFVRLNSIEDFLSDNQPHYIRKYPAQLVSYMLMDSKEEGVFCLLNKVSGEIKDIWFSLTPEILDFAEREIIQKAVAINKHVAQGTIPERIPYDSDICGGCEYAHICCPDMQFKNAEIATDEIIKLLARRSELEPLSKEYDILDAKIKDMCKGKPQVLAGDFIIQSKEYERTNYDVPKDIKDQYAKKSTYWRTTIQSLKK